MVSTMYSLAMHINCGYRSITLSLVTAGMVCALCVVGKIRFGVNSKFPPVNN